jgi:hypothetical protein
VPRKYEGLDGATARRIVRVCSDRKRGLHEVASALGREPGSLTSTLDKILEHGDLHSDVEPGSRRGAGTLFWADQAQLERAEMAAARAHDPGLVRTGQPLLILRCPSAASAVAVLRSSLVGATVTWAARMAGEGPTWLLALDPEAGPLVIDQIDAAAEQVGGSVSGFTPASVTDGAGLRRYMRAIGVLSTDRPT